MDLLFAMRIPAALRPLEDAPPRGPALPKIRLPKPSRRSVRKRAGAELVRARNGETLSSRGPGAPVDRRGRDVARDPADRS